MFDPTINIPVDNASIFADSKWGIAPVVYGAAADALAANNQVEITADSLAIEDFFLGDIDAYLLLSTNLTTIKADLVKKSVYLHVSYDERGKLKLDKFDCPFPLNRRQKRKLNDLVRAIPTWFDQQHANIVIELSKEN